jgi:hypothetical protein
MILVFPVVLAVAIVILWRARGEPGDRGRGCRWFWAWSLAGAALTFSFLTGLSIGLFVLPLALVLLWLVLRASPRWAESFGLFEGVGLLLLVVSYLNRGGDPHSWLYAGLMTSALAAIAYPLARRVSARAG